MLNDLPELFKAESCWDRRYITRLLQRRKCSKWNTPEILQVERVPYVYITSYVKSRECPMSMQSQELGHFRWRKKTLTFRHRKWPSTYDQMSLMCSEWIAGPLVSRYKQTKMTNTCTSSMKLHMLCYVCLGIIFAAKSDAVNSITASEIKREVEVNKYVLVLFSKFLI